MNTKNVQNVDYFPLVFLLSCFKHVIETEKSEMSEKLQNLNIN